MSMTRLDVIQLLGDLLTQLDVARGSLLPSDGRRPVLDALRDALDGRQATLVKLQLRENTAKYKKVTADLAAVNGEIQATIDDIEKFVGTVDAIGRLLVVVDELTKLAAGLK
jgi:ABC-type transporter Mla subunit MlaD